MNKPDLQSKIQQYFGKDLEAMSFANSYHNWIMDEIKNHLGKVVLEIGAGKGNFTEFLLSADIKTLYSCEPSNNMFQLLKNRFAKDPRVITTNETMMEFSEKREYPKLDTIVYINVLEHIENDCEEIEKAHEALFPGGKLLSFVPALPKLMSNFDRKVGHYRRYSKQRLKNIVEIAGFKIINLRFFDFIGAFAWFLAMKILRKDVINSSVIVYDKLFVPVVKALEKHFNLPFGKNLLLVAQK